MKKTVVIADDNAAFVNSLVDYLSKTTMMLSERPTTDWRQPLRLKKPHPIMH